MTASMRLSRSGSAIARSRVEKERLPHGGRFFVLDKCIRYATMLDIRAVRATHLPLERAEPGKGLGFSRNVVWLRGEMGIPDWATSCGTQHNKNSTFYGMIGAMPDGWHWRMDMRTLRHIPPLTLNISHPASAG